VYGGIGSGKSTLAELLGRLGATVIEADRIGHTILQPEGPAAAAVGRRWPDVLVDGVIDRSALAAIVFSDADQLVELEEITHPLIAEEIERLATAAGERPVVVELPLVRRILGDGWIWVLVEAPAELRMERAVGRGATAEDVAARMTAQPRDEDWHAGADWVVPNVGTVSDLATAAAELWSDIGPH
jgi:dephospho-CoA kinase